MTVDELELELARVLGEDGKKAMTVFRRHLPRLLGDLEAIHRLRELVDTTVRYTIEVDKLRELLG